MRFDIIEFKKNFYKYVLIASNGFQLNIGNLLSKFERSYLKYVKDNEPDNFIDVDLVIRTYNDLPYTMVVLVDMERDLHIDLRLGAFKDFVIKELENEKSYEVI